MSFQFSFDLKGKKSNVAIECAGTEDNLPHQYLRLNVEKPVSCKKKMQSMNNQIKMNYTKNYEISEE